jgi:aspartokinase-like uncharacterized kinase
MPAGSDPIPVSPTVASALWIFKLGGSLHNQPQLRHWLTALATHGGGRVVIVPGGGPFAETVRGLQELWEFPDLDAHHMALQAMEQFGRLLLAIEPRLVSAMIEPEITGMLARRQAVVWFPSAMVAADAVIEPSWEVTSDSLSAWLAGRLGAAHLALVKSTAPEPGRYEAEALAEQDIVDKQFPRYLNNARFRTWWLGVEQTDLVAAMLDGAPVTAEILR